jgi:hypothetical protein
MTAWGTLTLVSCPRVSFSAFLVRVTRAARAQRHGGHPEATGSKCFDR